VLILRPNEFAGKIEPSTGAAKAKQLPLPLLAALSVETLHQ